MVESIKTLIQISKPTQSVENNVWRGVQLGLFYYTSVLIEQPTLFELSS